jgi:hypothetical protein
MQSKECSGATIALVSNRDMGGMATAPGVLFSCCTSNSSIASTVAHQIAFRNKFPVARVLPHRRRREALRARPDLHAEAKKEDVFVGAIRPCRARELKQASLVERRVALGLPRIANLLRP